MWACKQVQGRFWSGCSSCSYIGLHCHVMCLGACKLRVTASQENSCDVSNVIRMRHDLPYIVAVSIATTQSNELIKH